MEDTEECSQLLLIRNGEAIAQGSADQLKKQYQEKTVEAIFLKAEANQKVGD